MSRGCLLGRRGCVGVNSIEKVWPGRFGSCRGWAGGVLWIGGELLIEGCVLVKIVTVIHRAWFLVIDFRHCAIIRGVLRIAGVS